MWSIAFFCPCWTLHRAKAYQHGTRRPRRPLRPSQPLKATTHYWWSHSSWFLLLLFRQTFHLEHSILSRFCWFMSILILHTGPYIHSIEITPIFFFSTYLALLAFLLKNFNSCHYFGCFFNITSFFFWLWSMIGSTFISVDLTTLKFQVSFIGLCNFKDFGQFFLEVDQCVFMRLFIPSL